MRDMNMVVLATQNEGKCREMALALAPLGGQVQPLSQWTRESVVEDGASFVENALLKARHAARVTGYAAIADDSGLCVRALAGAPGLYSARFAGEGSSDVANYQQLLARMQGVADRRAYYHCTLVAVRTAEDAAPMVCQGEWHGCLLTAAQGTGGFGYDPIFYDAHAAQSAAEMSLADKQARSHRGRAVAQLCAQWSAWWGIERAAER